MRKIISLLLVCVLMLSVAAGCAEEKNGIVALRVGDYKLTTADLSYFYMDKVIEYRQTIYDQYYGSLGSYWSAMMGFDPSKALNAQAYNEQMTWADYFIDLAIETARDIYAVYAEAQKANFTMSEAETANVEAMMESLASYATYYGYEDINAYLRMWYGAFADEASYRKYYEVTTVSYSYLDHYSNSLQLDAEDYKAYDQEHYDEFSVVSFDYFSLSYKSYLGEGVKDDAGNTTWTDEEIQAARAALAADIETMLAANITVLSEFDAALQALDVHQKSDSSTKVTAMVVEKTPIGSLSLTAESKDWLKAANRVEGHFGAFPVYTYPEHADKEHIHGDDCGCERALDSCVFLLFTGRDEQRSPLVNIRHILVRFTNGTTDSNGNVTYADVDKLKAKETAEKLYQQWKNGEATEESFAALANAESDDMGGMVTNGGLYEWVHSGQMVKNFDAWCFDPIRKAGDTGIIETEYGYHLMYFCSVDEMTYREKLIDYALRTKATEEWYKSVIESVDSEVVDLSEMNYALKLSS